MRGLIAHAGMWWAVVPILLAASLPPGARVLAGPRGATVNIRWQPSVTESARRTIEVRFRLADGEAIDRDTWRYDLLDPSSDNIRVLVREPAVADTHNIDRPNGTLESGATRTTRRQRFPASGDRLVAFADRLAVTVAVMTALLLLVHRMRRSPAADALWRGVRSRLRPPATAPSLQPVSSPAQCSVPTDVLIVVLLATAWLSRFWYSAQFGLYEDDPARVISGMQATLDVLWRGFLWEWPSQGRPFHPYFIYLFSFVGGKLGGMHGLYWMAYLIFAANMLLLHRLLLKVSGLQAFAATAALGYALFPAETTQAYLTNSFGGQTAMTLFLLAALAYTSGRRVVGYLLAFASLFTYETVFPLFLAVPLLSSDWDRRLLKKMLRHAALLGAMLVVTAVLRKLGGESRMSSLDLATLLVHPFRQMGIGPAVVIWTFVYRPYQALAHHLATSAGIVSCAFIVFTMVLLRLDVPGVLATRETERGESSRGIGQASLQSVIWKLVLVGLTMLALAYPIAFTTSAGAIDGRETRVHLPAAIGSAILFGCFCTIALHVSRRGALRSIVRASLAVWLAGLVGFGLTIQNDYLTNWRFQRSFWTDLVTLCPDLEDGLVILVDQSGLKNTAQISAWGWDLPYMLRHVYDFPAEWKSPPLVYTLRWNWRQLLAEGKQPLETVDLKGWILEPVTNPKFILVTVAGGKLQRNAEPLSSGAHSVVLKNRGESTVEGLRHSFVYDSIMLPESTERREYALK